MQLIDGNKIAADIIAELKAEVSGLPGRKPCIALVRVGEDPASVSYVKKKDKSARNVELMVFLRPKITRTPEEARTLLEDLDQTAPLIAPWKHGGAPSLDEKAPRRRKPAEADPAAESGSPTPAE